MYTGYLQTFDYIDRQTSFNRRQMTIEADGSFRMVLAHRDPGLPNWLDTMGRAGGTIVFFTPKSRGAQLHPRRLIIRKATNAWVCGCEAQTRHPRNATKECPATGYLQRGS